MFAINNIIHSLSNNRKNLNIILFNSFFDEYIEILCKLDHNFYIISETAPHQQWHTFNKNIPNLKYCSSQWDFSVSHFDFIIVFDRTALYHIANNFSHIWHIPIIVVDLASSEIKEPTRLFEESQFNCMIQNNGVINISTSENVKKSWLTPWTSEINYSIYIPPMRNRPPSNQSKILIDKNFTKEYLDNMPISIGDDYTSNYDEGIVYLNLWQTYTPLMSDCMQNEIPIVTFEENSQLKEFEDICFFIKENENPLSILDRKDFSDKIKNGKYFIADKTLDVFCNKWSNALNYAQNVFYKRGEYAR